MNSHTETAQSLRPVTLKELFFGSLKIGLLGLGGVAPWARRIIVGKLGWLTEQEYISIFGVGQVFPGANTVNAAVMIGIGFKVRLPGMNGKLLWQIAAPFASLSLVSIGGANAVVPEIHHQIVERLGWMNDTAFTSIFCDFASRAGSKCSSGQPDRLAHSRVCGTRDCNSCDDPSL